MCSIVGAAECAARWTAASCDGSALHVLCGRLPAFYLDTLQGVWVEVVVVEDLRGHVERVVPPYIGGASRANWLPGPAQYLLGDNVRGQSCSSIAPRRTRNDGPSPEAAALRGRRRSMCDGAATPAQRDGRSPVPARRNEPLPCATARFILGREPDAPCLRILAVEGLTMRFSGRPARTMMTGSIRSSAPAAAERPR